MKSSAEKLKSKSKNNKKENKLSVMDNVSMLVQAVIFTLLIIFFVISIFNNELFVIVETLVALLMFLTAYNNYKIYKRKGMTLVYIIFGLLIFGVVISEFING